MDLNNVLFVYRMVLILSFDCGVINLAWCLYDAKTDTIIDWQVKSLQKNVKRDNLCEHLIDKLDDWGFDTLLNLKNQSDEMHVVIENQPFRNAACKIIEVTLQSYFVMRAKRNDKYPVRVKEICSISPRVKLRGHSGGDIKLRKGAKGYKGRKERGVQVIADLDCIKKSQEWQCYFSQLKKQDDAADAILQAIGYKEDSVNKTRKASCDKIIARKPIKSKDLSEANCKWMLKQILYPKNRKKQVGSFERIQLEVDKSSDLKKAVDVLMTDHGNLESVLSYLGLIR